MLLAGGLHILALLALFLAIPQPSGKAGGTSAVTVITLGTAPETPAETAPDRVKPVRPSTVGAAASPLPVQTAGGAGAEACSPLETLEQALRDDAGALAALAALPPGERTVSEAVMLWSDIWMPVAGDEAAALSPLRVRIEQTLRTLPQDCLEAPVTGPRFVTLRAGSSDNTLVFGSGEWNWAELIEPAPLAGPAQAEAGIAAMIDEFFWPL